MIQQITNTRTNKQLTTDDLARISYAVCLNFFHTNTMFNPWPLGIYAAVDYYYVKRLRNDCYQYQQCWSTTSSGGKSPHEMNTSYGQVKTISLNQVKELHADLVCNQDGEERILIDFCYRKYEIFYNKQKLGLFILSPKIISARHRPNESDNSLSICNIFTYGLVITPKPGLFPIQK